MKYVKDSLKDAAIAGLFILAVILSAFLLIVSIKVRKLETKVNKQIELFNKFVEVHDDNVYLFNENWEDQWEWNENMVNWADEIHRYLE